MCPYFTWGLHCAENCTCVEDNTEYCDPVNGFCSCKDGWENTTCSDDVNECDSFSCPLNSTCVNSLGSFECVCDPGFFKSAVDICTGTLMCHLKNPCKQSSQCRFIKVTRWLVCLLVDRLLDHFVCNSFIQSKDLPIFRQLIMNNGTGGEQLQV